MRINHLAMWVRDLELIKDFYIKYFDVKASDKYINPMRGFESYFLTFDDGFRLEIMSISGVKSPENKASADYEGYCHLALSTGSKNTVKELTELLATDGYKVTSSPRTTGDGYYESVVLDPENNRIEITI